MSTFGPDYDPRHDRKRLLSQLEMIRDVMLSAGEMRTWLTLREIAQITRHPEASVSAQLRHLRKKEFGSHIVEKRRRGRPGKGLWEYLVRRASPSANTQLILCLAERSVLRECQP